jgi:hypothetical protein
MIAFLNILRAKHKIEHFRTKKCRKMPNIYIIYFENFIIFENLSAF